MTDSNFPVLVKDGKEQTPTSMTEFVQLNYDGWAKKDPDAVLPDPKPADPETATPLIDATPPTPPAGTSVPPMGGKGSGIEDWRAYANELDVDTDGLETRDQIVDAIHDAGHPVERPTE